MKAVLDQAKDYEKILAARDPAIADIIVAIEITKDFIRSKGLILYGGTALDLALRLRGSSIYSDDSLQVPDLDFYSPNSVSDSYELADLIQEKVSSPVKAINAMHIETMKVNVGTISVADISYRPEEIFRKLPFLVYDRMKIIDPLYQKIDSHSALAFPFDNAPREVIFARKGKDIDRLNKIEEHYPLPVSKYRKEGMTKVKHKIPRSALVIGFGGYALTYYHFTQLVKSVESYSSLNPDLSLVLPLELKVENKFVEYETPKKVVELVHFNAREYLTEIGAVDIKSFEPFSNITPSYSSGMVGDLPYTVYNLKGRLVATGVVEVEDRHVRTANVQYLMKDMLSRYYKYDRDEMYLSLYLSLRRMISIVEDLLEFVPEPVRESIVSTSLLFPTINVYGDTNFNSADEVNMSRMKHAIDKTEEIRIPWNYYADRNNDRPEFDPDQSEPYRILGREIKLKSD